MTNLANMTDILNKQIANWSVLFIKLHNYHWYVTGPQFFTLHAKFEELYNEAAVHIDTLAERVLALGAKPITTMDQYLRTASVKEADVNEDANQMVKSIVDDYKSIIGETKAGMEMAQTANDETTSDMLLSIQTELEKHVWMLQAFLK